MLAEAKAPTVAANSALGCVAFMVKVFPFHIRQYLKRWKDKWGKEFRAPGEQSLLLYTEGLGRLAPNFSPGFPIVRDSGESYQDRGLSRQFCEPEGNQWTELFISYVVLNQ